MTDEFDRAKDLFRWSERLFSVLGAWPLRSSYEWFTICSIYYTAHIIMECADMYCVLGNFPLMVENFSETAFEMLIFMKLLLIRFSHKMMTIVQRTIDGIDIKFFENIDEQTIYLNYNRLGKTFFKAWNFMGITVSLIYYFTPLAIRFQAAAKGEVAPFVLPYRVRLFFAINDSTTYYLTWMYQAPVIGLNFSNTVAIGFVYSLILHVCGLLAVLAYRMRNLDLGERKEPESFRIVFRDIVKRHRIIIELVDDINDVFGLILLGEVILTTVLIGLTCYVALTSLEKDGSQFLACISYGLGLLPLIYGYCEAGEYLITESMNLHTAYYQCLWYDMPDSFKRQLLICMIGASKPLQFTGRGVYIFCLLNFMGIVKTAVGYTSMLRTML